MKKFYVKAEIEIEAENESKAASKVVGQFEENTVAVDAVYRYPSGFFERHIEMRKQYALKKESGE